MPLQKENIITISNVRKSFRNVSVLASVSLEIKKGEIFCLLGSNGAGKTTLVNILANTTLNRIIKNVIYTGILKNGDTQRQISLGGQCLLRPLRRQTDADNERQKADAG